MGGGVNTPMSFVSQPCVLGAAFSHHIKRRRFVLLCWLMCFFLFLESAEIWVLSEALCDGGWVCSALWVKG